MMTEIMGGLVLAVIGLSIGAGLLYAVIGMGGALLTAQPVPSSSPRVWRIWLSVLASVLAGYGLLILINN
jgi:hypothetical protein